MWNEVSYLFFYLSVRSITNFPVYLDRLIFAYQHSIGGNIGAVIGIVTGIAIAITYGYLAQEYSNIYQSTFSDQNWGHKYMWMFLISDYYYPWEPLSYYSNGEFSVSGYLSNGNVQGILPQISTGTVVGAYISQGANNFVNSHGQNNFVWMGS
ncbi:MAG: hypothetical protein ACYCR7_06475 [Thermoplasmataceae archaeon]